MVTYGDGVSDVDINKLIVFHKRQNTIGTITGVHPRSKYGMVIVDKSNMVRKFSEKPVINDWVNGGFMIFDKRFFDYLRPEETEHPGLIRLVEERRLSLYKHNGFWKSVDTYMELGQLNDIWNSGNPPWKIWE